MNAADQLIAGYTAYTDSAEIAAGATAEAPAITPTVSVTVLSTEGVVFSAGVVLSASASGTLAGNC
ncbi:LxmA leader domain family RiPP [Streptomyces bacillaris]|uniref:LxmA leader domain family RiPP n=1 Tax=Streptomyces TaxID=1883 RepID=UPI0006AD2A31|nr:MULTISPECIES: LxmA leader domain family RiPP [Streptomyces]ALC29171.1 hypothetical protein ABE83_20425 [Streptomyces sp. CFMR 7]MBT3077414.1 LxmA leader domain family RiPP [Streptomyces sp. COG21]MBT3082736.1 LxmA leader domain family RiPP [Streptomyces sp. COG20]MBT3087557.1 LxmA leader domain family RiPP [Streptomyces sp. CYG21]MBT3097411.1 LxmA leader domain family RiPP [Streptomyces sp. CBG30]